MLERFFSDPSALERFEGGPIGSHLECFATRLASLGYATLTVRSQIELLGEFGQWLSTNSIAIANIGERVVRAFLSERPDQRRLRRGQASTLRRFVDHLRSVGAVPSSEPEAPASPLDVLVAQYEGYLRSERGLARATVICYLPFVRRFLHERFGSNELRLGQLAPSDLSDFILHHAYSMGPKTAQLMVTALRSFFRFLLERGEIEVDLSSTIPTVAGWRLSKVPKYLTPKDVEALLAACDRKTSTGRRNYAILLLLARLGLRAGEIVALNLEDIDWRAGEISVAGKGLFRDRMPLPADAGEALATYLRRDRPPSCQSRRVFIQIKAPQTGFAGPSTVSTIVRRALSRAGLQPAVKGAHLLRHSLATAMLRQGGSLAEIGEVLRHRAAATTEIYAKVDFDGLRGLGLPWPKTGGQQ